MNLGSNIVELRKANNMSQEEFAEVFNVSRQTISNWENSKSYPDLGTLVLMSDTFDVSLDVLLKEDKLMVETMDNEIKKTRQYKKLLVALGCVLVVALLAFGIFFTLFSMKYDAVKTELEMKYHTALKENDFQQVDRVYEKKVSDNIRFLAPNQGMPSRFDFKLHFYAKFLYAYINQDDYVYEIIWNEENSFAIDQFEREQANGFSYGDKYIDTVYNSDKDDLTIEQLSKKLHMNKKQLKSVIEQGNRYYADLY